MIQTIAYCECALHKTVTKLPNPISVKGDLPMDFANEVGIECMAEVKEAL